MPKRTSVQNNKIVSLAQRKDIGKALMTMAQDLVSRAFLGDQLGKSYYSSSGTGAKRDLYKTLGYIKNPTFANYLGRYKRGDIAKRIVDALPQATWRIKPYITEPGGKDRADQTPFEKAFSDLIKTKNVWHYLRRADILSGIGEYGILLLGFNDNKELSEEVKSATELSYLRPYTQGSVTIHESETDPKSPRYGFPKVYKVNVRSATSQSSGSSIMVHQSRVLHFAEGLTDDDIYGTPSLEPVLNRLQDLDLLCGGSAEMFWRGAFPGYTMTAKDDAEFTPDSMEELEDEIQAYLHDLQRYMRLRGVDVQNLEQQVADPGDHVEVLLTVIAAAKAIPKRILLGSERGELASSQDERAWLERVDERRTDYIGPLIIRNFIDRLIKVKVLPTPKDGNYEIEWPPLVALGQKEEIEIAKGAAEAIGKYVISPGADQLVPPEVFLKKYLKFTEAELEQCKKYLETVAEEDDGFSDLEDEELDVDEGDLDQPEEV